MTWLTPTDAANWIKSKIRDLFNARKDLQDAYGRALLAQSKAKDAQTQQEATALIAKLQSSLNKQTELENSVKMVLPSSWIPGDITLGLIPLIPIAALGVAAALYVHFQDVANEKKLLALVEAKTITPAEAAQLRGGGFLGAGGLGAITGNIGTIAIVALLGYGLFLVGPMLTRRH